MVENTTKQDKQNNAAMSPMARADGQWFPKNNE
jgi:hypothetical protein